MEITRQYNRFVHNEGLVVPDRIMKEGTLGLVTTHAANGLSTDSAAAATALATGCKAKLDALGICADDSVPKTAMEIAQEKGMRVGLVTNAMVYDASPAAFASHLPNRRNFAAIVKRYLELEPEVLLGGGREQFLPKAQAGSRRSDDVDLIAAFVKKGYRYVINKQELEEAQHGKVLGLFSLGDMSFEIDRNQQTEPSIVDMTRAAIRLLHNGNPRGFFVFIENENVDTASHQTDIASMIRDYREFDRAVGLAYEFYRKYPRETLILVTSDHETGGLGFTLALKDLTSTQGANQVCGEGRRLEENCFDPNLAKEGIGNSRAAAHRRSHRRPHERIFQGLHPGAGLQRGDHQTAAHLAQHLYRSDDQRSRHDGGQQHAGLLANHGAYQPAGLRGGSRGRRGKIQRLSRQHRLR